MGVVSVCRARKLAWSNSMFVFGGTEILQEKHYVPVRCRALLSKTLSGHPMAARAQYLKDIITTLHV